MDDFDQLRKNMQLFGGTASKGEAERIRIVESTGGIVDEYDDMFGKENITGANDTVQELEDLYEEMLEWLERADSAVRAIGDSTIRARAEQYWLAHIKSNVNSREFGYGGADYDLARTINELNDDGSGDK